MVIMMAVNRLHKLHQIYMHVCMDESQGRNIDYMHVGMILALKSKLARNILLFNKKNKNC